MYRMMARNKRNTVLILFLFLLFTSVLGWIIGIFMGSPITGLIITLIIGVAYTLFQYYSAGSQAMALAGAHRIAEQDEPRLWRTVENLSITTGLPMPEVYVVDDPAPNAFATGRDPKHAKVAATTGLLKLLDDSELEGVMAHEMGHVKNYDIRVSMIVFGLVVVVGVIADWLMTMAFIGGGNRNRDAGPMLLIIGLVVAVIAPLTATVVQLAVSRQREYLADATGAHITRHPAALSSALGKLQEYARPMRRQNSSMAHLWIADPMKPGLVDRMFATHPPISERRRRLAQMASGESF